MHDLHDEIMQHVGKAVHDYYDKTYPDSRGSYGDSVDGEKICDAIAEEVKACCVEAERRLRQSQEEFDSLESDVEDIENEKDEALAEVEEIEGEAEHNKMVEQFWYYCEKTNV